MIALLLVACGDYTIAQGTAVGNPPGVSAELGSTDGLTLRTATVGVDTIRFEAGDGAEDVTTVAADVDLLGAPWFEAPSGDYDRLRIEFSSPLEVAADGVDGGTASIHLDVREIDLRGEFSTTDPLLLLLGGVDWVTARGLGVADGVDVTFDETSSGYSDVVHAFEDGSALYRDPDGTGASDPSNVVADDHP